MWFHDDAGTKLFSGGQEDWAAAKAAAAQCSGFRADEDDEQCDEELLSCYNCRYRRWTIESFVCMAS